MRIKCGRTENRIQCKFNPDLRLRVDRPKVAGELLGDNDVSMTELSNNRNKLQKCPSLVLKWAVEFESFSSHYGGLCTTKQT